MHISVLIPSYKRPEYLARCLAALERQTRAPDEIVIAMRSGDMATAELAGEARNPASHITAAITARPGVVAALNAGLSKVRGDVVAITDDDAEPRPGWLARIEAHFASDPALGGLGGRDFVFENGRQQADTRLTVGKLQWFGREIGNHHLGAGGVREVDILKGVNMSYRREAIAGRRFDERLLGHGSQPCNDMGFSLSVRKAGWKLLYDPAVAVDHRTAPRGEDYHRHEFQYESTRHLAHNATVVVLDYLPPASRLAFIAWAFLAGSRAEYGLVQFFRFAAGNPRLSLAKLAAAWHGRVTGIRAWMIS